MVETAQNDLEKCKYNSNLLTAARLRNQYAKRRVLKLGLETYAPHALVRLRRWRFKTTTLNT